MTDAILRRLCQVRIALMRRQQGVSDRITATNLAIVAELEQRKKRSIECGEWLIEVIPDNIATCHKCGGEAEVPEGLPTSHKPKKLKLSKPREWSNVNANVA